MNKLKLIEEISGGLNSHLFAKDGDVFVIRGEKANQTWGIAVFFTKFMEVNCDCIFIKCRVGLLILGGVKTLPE